MHCQIKSWLKVSWLCTKQQTSVSCDWQTFVAVVFSFLLSSFFTSALILNSHSHSHTTHSLSAQSFTLAYHPFTVCSHSHLRTTHSLSAVIHTCIPPIHCLQSFTLAYHPFTVCTVIHMILLSVYTISAQLFSCSVHLFNLCTIIHTYFPFSQSLYNHVHLFSIHSFNLYNHVHLISL